MLGTDSTRRLGWVLLSLITAAPLAAWDVHIHDDILAVHLDTGEQVAALHLDSSYFRLTYGPGSGWGTSVVLLPSLWIDGIYHQGAPLTVTWTDEPDDAPGQVNLRLDWRGDIAGLSVTGSLVLQPPVDDRLVAEVQATCDGTVDLDERPGEAFKPLMLSSMRISDTDWDARQAVIDEQAWPLPVEGWLIQPPVVGTALALIGGDSVWKPNAPTITVVLDETRPITGWVTRSRDPNDDNVALWAAADRVLPAWSYRLVASRAAG